MLFDKILLIDIFIYFFIGREARQLWSLDIVDIIDYDW